MLWTQDRTLGSNDLLQISAYWEHHYYAVNKVNDSIITRLNQMQKEWKLELMVPNWVDTRTMLGNWNSISGGYGYKVWIEGKGVGDPIQLHRVILPSPAWPTFMSTFWRPENWGFQSKEATRGRNMIGIGKQDAKKRRAMELLLALRAREVAPSARIFQAITQVKTRVQQNTLRYCSLNEAKFGLMLVFSTTCQCHFVVSPCYHRC